MFGDVPLVLVQDPAALREAVEAMRPQAVLAVDLEADSFHHYRERVCLLQVSIPGTDYVIDPLAIQDISAFLALLEDPGRVKVLHGADYDVVSLKRDYRVQIRGLFDTMIAAQFLGVQRFGLADLLASNFDVTIDKALQRHDWSRRPLLPAHLHYARGDTHWLLALREIMLYRLRRAGWERAVHEECQQLELREWHGRTPDPADFLRIKGASELDETGKRVLRALYAYREEQASQMDRPVFKVIPDPVLAAIARHRPSTIEDLAGTMRRGSALMRQHGAALVRAVARGLEDESSLPKRVAAPRTPRAASGVAHAKAVELLKSWRQRQSSRDGLAASLIASNNVIRELARALPESREQLDAVAELRSWQADHYGEALLEVIAEARDEVAPKSKSKRRRRKRS
ncbi:MAG: HRDC domain-containing protein [Pseudomonadota bacterium]